MFKSHISSIKYIVILFIALLYFIPIASFAQTKVAILPVIDRLDQVNYAHKLLLRSNITTAIAMTEGYEGYDRIDLSSVMDEQDFQRKGLVSDKEIHEIGVMTGADFVIIAEAAKLDDEHIVASAKIVNVESAKIENSAQTIVDILDFDQMLTNCKTLTQKLLKPTGSQVSAILSIAKSFFQKGEYAKSALTILKVKELSNTPEGSDLLDKAQRCDRLLNDAKSYLSKNDEFNALKFYKKLLSINSGDKNALNAIVELSSPKLKITQISFGNTDFDNNVITDYEETLYYEEVKYIKAKIYYDVLCSSEKQIRLFNKIYNNEGKLMTGDNSPAGYTSESTITLHPGNSDTARLTGYGNKNGFAFPVGRYKYEIWYNEELLYSTYFEVKLKGYVDLGLSVKWATCNLGANSPEDFGGYYSWGEIYTKSNYSEDAYKYHKLVKTLPLDSDAVHVKLGGKYRMPTPSEFRELRDKCKWTWANKNGVKGYKITGSNGNSIFLPAAGHRGGTKFYYVEEKGNYWTSERSSAKEAISLRFDSGNIYSHYPCWRFLGFSLRPVID